RKRLAARERAHDEARHAQFPQGQLIGPAPRRRRPGGRNAPPVSDTRRVPGAPPLGAVARQPALPVLTMAIADAISPPTSDRFDGRISVLPSLATLPKAST